jgi:hypothetical protein
VINAALRNASDQVMGRKEMHTPPPVHVHEKKFYGC